MIKPTIAASDSAKIEFAKKTYPIGTRYKNAHPNSNDVVTLTTESYKLNYLGEENSIGTNGDGWILWHGVWAEIVEEVKSVPKSGDQIEYCFDEPNGWGGGIYIGMNGEKFVVWTGRVYVEALGIRTIDETPEKIIERKDKEGAKEILKSNGLLDENGCCSVDIISSVLEAIKYGRENKY